MASVLRLRGLDRVPVSMFSDELDVGYQAYSILKTGKDYFGNFLPLHFESYVENRAPLYIYSTVPTVAALGITPYGVRLPAAIFGILGVGMMYLLIKEIVEYAKIKEKIYTEGFPLLCSFMMALSPWHIQYSRAAFEASELIFLVLTSLYFFFKGLKKPRLLWVSALMMGLAPWTYSTAKLFAPVFIIFLASLFYKDLFKLPIKHLKKAVITLLILGIPMALVIMFGGGALRFSRISVFGEEAKVAGVSTERLQDAKVRNVTGGGIVSKIESRLAHNKINTWSSTIAINYLKSFSAEFLFISGDVSDRHSVSGMGQFYKFEAILLVLGLILFFKSKFRGEIKLLIGFWTLFGVVPAAITLEGGGHATRLILILPSLIFLMAFGLIEIIRIVKIAIGQKIIFTFYVGAMLASFFMFQHNYWNHYAWESERSWHSGFKEAIEGAAFYEDQFDKIVITNSEERPYIFLAAYKKYDPILWQKGFEEKEVVGFGLLKNIGKYYFGQVDGRIGIENLGSVMEPKTLYVASQREVESNLITYPEKVPPGLSLVKAISFPSGEPAFYLLRKI